MKDPDTLNADLQIFLAAMNDLFCKMTMTCNIHHLAIKMLTKVSAAYTKGIH